MKKSKTQKSECRNNLVKTKRPTIRLSKNDRKGYNFEMKAQRFLERFGISFVGNPRDPEEWKRNISYGTKNSRSEPDIIIPHLKLEIECKAVYRPAWAGGIKANYVGRFHDLKHRVVLTNNLKMYNEKCKTILKNAGIIR